MPQRGGLNRGASAGVSPKYRPPQIRSKGNRFRDDAPPVNRPPRRGFRGRKRGPRFPKILGLSGMLNRYPAMGIRCWNFDLNPYLRVPKNQMLALFGTMLVLATTLFSICGGQGGKSTLFLGPGVARKSRRTRRGAYAHCPPVCPERCSVLWPPSGLPRRRPRFPPVRIRANATQSHETVETATKPRRNPRSKPRNRIFF